MLPSGPRVEQGAVMMDPVETPMFDREQVGEWMRRLAARDVYLGTSSWKYPGWIGSLYTADRYLFRGKHSEARFERTCLPEYAEVFRSVCVDAAYYSFPTEPWLASLASSVPVWSAATTPRNMRNLRASILSASTIWTLFGRRS
jgi:hypothetical protein